MGQLRIGVLALQGAFAEHMVCLARLSAAVIAVRLPGQLDGLDGLVIPGGESTTIGKLMRLYGLLDELRALARQGLPIYGTCAGMILLAGAIHGDDGGAIGENRIGGMDIVVRRNAFGRQLASFETDLDVPAVGQAPFRGIFIRAPLIAHAGSEVRILCRLPDGSIVGAEQGGMLVTAFHPELTSDGRIHDYFLRKAASRRAGPG